MHIVFGGSFNPPTIAHRQIILKLQQTFLGSRVLVLPVGDDYQKPELISIKHRIRMLELMTSNMNNVLISDLEVKRSWNGTLQSLNELSKIYDDLHFVIGSDNLIGLFDWINYKQLLSTYPVIIMTRKGSLSPKEAEQWFHHLPHHFEFVDFNEDISSTVVRQRVHQSSDYLMPEVYQYIIENHLYKEIEHV